MAFGSGVTTSGVKSVGLGRTITSSGSYSAAVGTSCTASANDAVCVGSSSSASAVGAVAIGKSCTNSGSGGIVAGNGVVNTVANACEFGIRETTGSDARVCAVRLHGDGQTSFTLRNNSSAVTDGGATSGSEANGKLGRGMYTIQRNGNAVILYFNDAGSIRTLALGTAS